MLNVKNYSEKYWHKIRIFKNLSYTYVSFTLAFCVAIIILDYFKTPYLNVLNPLAAALFSLNIIIFISSSFFEWFALQKIQKFSILRFKKIINLSKINGNPKVVYVYTCRNDLIETCFLQNIKQTYQNIEFWISDGGTNPNISAKIELFARNNNVNYYKVNKFIGSKSKADNINHFLKETNVTFDYLLITDSDELIAPTFVENSLKLLTNKKYFDVHFVSALNYLYTPTTVYGAIQMNKWNRHFMMDYIYSLTNSNHSNLYSCSCVLSKKVLDCNKGLFPESSLEDMYLQEIAYYHKLTGAILPVSPCCQSPDSNLSVELSKHCRIYDWWLKMILKYRSKEYCKNHDFFSHSSVVWFLIKPIFWIMAIILFPLPIWILCIYGRFLFHNYLFILLFSIVLFFIFILPIVTIKTKSKLSKTNKFIIFLPLFNMLYGLCEKIEEIKHWLKVMCFKKYADFIPSGEIGKRKNKLVKHWIFLIVSCLSIIFLALCQCLLVTHTNIWILFGFVYGFCALSTIFLTALSYILLYAIGNIKVNINLSNKAKIKFDDFYKKFEI